MIVTPAHWCLDTQDNGRSLVVRFTGRQVRLAEQHVRLAEDYLFGPGQGVGGREVVLDLSNVACVASTALAVLVRLHARVAAAAGQLRLEGVSPHLAEVLEVTETDRVLDARKAEALPVATPAG
jgi:anti-anti-sigma factor